ncbi:odorant receptor 83a-like [Osmia lignaria lignaria]|uniref:odorant receptor 83a-like n=1 Tax=Osmia lignaria lignaria TaxID=1437193 RepID=UPI001479377C|nr:odorant receptor 22c-like [Osmia lignaria]
MQKSKSIDNNLSSIDFEYERNVNLSIQWNRWILKPMGLWPNSSNVSRFDKCLYWLINAVCYFLIFYLIIPCGLYMVFDMENLYKEIKLFGPLIFCVAAFVKYHWLIIRSDNIRECMEHIKWDWKNVEYIKDKDIMAMNANFAKRIVTICAIFMFTACTFYFLIIPLALRRIFIQTDNVTFIPVMYPFSSYIVDVRYPPINEIIFSIQFLAGVLINAITVGACSLAAVLAVHACGQMEVLMCWLKHLVDGRPDIGKTVDERIAKIVSQHVRILKFLTLMERTLRPISFAEFLACTLNLCLVGYYIITEWNSRNIIITVGYVILYTSLTFNIFIFCYIGELVAEQCRKVGETSYMIEWYRLAGKRKLFCILVMEMSNSSIKLTAGSMIELSISTFTDVVKTSVAFLNVLRKLT